MMNYLKTFETYKARVIGSDNYRSLHSIIMNLHGIPKERKEEALTLLNSYTKAGRSKISGLRLNKDLKSKISDGDYPSGFDMGIDKDGYFIHTHRARSKSYQKASDITVKEIRFIDSTG